MFERPMQDGVGGGRPMIMRQGSAAILDYAKKRLSASRAVSRGYPTKV
jgi:hypothetical protein